jgi:benzoylformate decarboxylase
MQKAGDRTRLVHEQKEALDNAFFEISQKSKENIPISASRLMAELRDVVTPDTIVVDDCWTASAALRRTLNFSEPGTYLRIRSSGSIGWGIPAALGAKLAAPERQVVAVAGDGSAMWSIQSLWTASRYNIPIVSVICCNGRYGQVKSVKRMLLGEKAAGKSLGENIDNPSIDFSQIAGSMGVHSQKVKRPDELNNALISAIESKKPELIEVYMEN